MRENLGLSLDMEHEYMVAGRSFHMVEKLTHKALMLIANTAAVVLIGKDPVNGVTREDVLMRDPVLVFEMFDILTDLDLTEYKEREEDSVLGLYEDAYSFINACDVFQYMFERITDAYMDVAFEVRRQAKNENSVGALLRSFGRYMNGDGTQKDIGLIRKMLTDMLIKQKKPDEQTEKNTENKTENIVDLSMYKVKKDK